MRIHVEAKPKEYSFAKDFPKKSDRRDLAEVLRNQTYALDWAAVYKNGRQYMFYKMDDLIKALQYDKFEL